ncbi:MAG: hypothetical protein IPH44_42775 [Myxococcales bacterium]|nr:hypothetical protein [Myxococcales bacterium]MBK7192878.1 hypothetical protein [Myxococcales bacterium]MBP6849206.1 hypothetical protein [Kofleriaceae bacterium]
MTTTDERPARRGPRWNVDGRALRLWTISGLATTYLVAWWCFAPAPTTAPVADEPLPAPVPTATAAPIPPAVWWHDLPPSERPAIALPSGWVVTATKPGDGPTLKPVPIARRPPARRVRVRTRSS